MELKRNSTRESVQQAGVWFAAVNRKKPQIMVNPSLFVWPPKKGIMKSEQEITAVIVN